MDIQVPLLIQLMRHPGRQTRLAGFIILILLPYTASAFEAMQILVLGLSRDHAVLYIDGRQQLLRKGQTSPEGITLLEANSETAVLQYQNRAGIYPLGSQFGGIITPPEALPSVTLWPTNGMYMSHGTINGFSVDFLVDTGASAIALNSATARRLGIDIRFAPRVSVRTASSVTEAFEVTLAEVQLGEIKLRNIRALVIDGAEPSQTLLGMSFLNQLDMHRRGDRLDLVQKYR